MSTSTPQNSTSIVGMELSQERLKGGPVAKARVLPTSESGHRDEDAQQGSLVSSVLTQELGVGQSFFDTHGPAVSVAVEVPEVKARCSSAWWARMSAHSGSVTAWGTHGRRGGGSRGGRLSCRRRGCRCRGARVPGGLLRRSGRPGWR